MTTGTDYRGAPEHAPMSQSGTNTGALCLRCHDTVPEPVWETMSTRRFMCACGAEWSTPK